MTFSKARGLVLGEGAGCVGEGVDWEIGKFFFLILLLLLLFLIILLLGLTNLLPPRLPPTLPIPKNINLTLWIPLLLHLQFRLGGKFLL